MKHLFRSAAPAIILDRGRRRTCDVAFPYRMGAGFSGDINRTHPFNSEPVPVDPTSPPLFYGSAGIIDGTSKKFRRLLAGDTAVTFIYGVAARPYPTAAVAPGNFGAAQGFGSGAPPTNQPLSAMRWGYVLVPIVGTPGKGDPVFVWVAASSGAHVQGGFEAGSTGGSTAALDVNHYTFNGPPDANGIGEIICGIAG